MASAEDPVDEARLLRDRVDSLTKVVDELRSTVRDPIIPAAAALVLVSSLAAREAGRNSPSMQRSRKVTSLFDND